MHVENYVKKLRPKEEGKNLWITMQANKLRPALEHLRSIGLARISSITGTDTGKEIDVIYHFIHKSRTINIRISVDKKNCSVESITDLYPGANLFERELSEMLGIKVKHHPNPKNLFLSSESPVHPLRKS